MLLILTSKIDFAADYMILKLIEMNQPYFRINLDEWQASDIRLYIDNKIEEKCLSLYNNFLNFDEVKAIWYRRAIHPQTTGKYAEPAERFVSGELQHLARGLLENPSIKWVNPIEKVNIGELKIYQLRVAQKLGFQIPKTIISGDKTSLESFSNLNASGTICKPIYHGLYNDGHRRNAVYTRPFLPEELKEEDYKHCPIFLQELIEKRCDIRITFIGNYVFGCRIFTDKRNTDWRLQELEKKYEAFDVPQNTIDKCRNMMKYFGLLYGAFDFLETYDGEFIFLEINPTGEWAWLEEKLKFPMRDAFVNLFYD